MTKSISLLSLLTLAVLFTGQISHADEFDERAGAEAAAEAQRADQKQYAKDLAEINADNRAVLARVRSLAASNGGAPKHLLCYEGLEWNFGRSSIGAESDYTWTMMYGVPVGQRIQHVTAGNIIGDIAMSPFTIGAALHGSESEEPQRPQHSYPPFLGTCSFNVKNKVCRVVRYINDGGIGTRCL